MVPPLLISLYTKEADSVKLAQSVQFIPEFLRIDAFERAGYMTTDSGATKQHPATFTAAGSESARLAEELGRITGMSIYPRSIVTSQECTAFMARRGLDKFFGLVVAGEAAGFEGNAKRASVGGRDAMVLTCPTSTANAAAARKALPFLVPQALGLRKSAGCGDRLGLATPGHVRAVRDTGVAPIFAQQSVRENARTGRTPQQVMDDALWGVLQEGWLLGFGADADHLKGPADVDSFAAAGYTFFTFDPGEFVANEADNAAPGSLPAMVEALPWEVLESTPADLKRSLSRSVDLGSLRIEISETDLLRAAAKYGRAVAHTTTLYRHLCSVVRQPFEVEMSVDETDTVTTAAEHVYIAHELKRLGVRWVSLAPRYVGRFEKGVDYIGDIAEFEQSFAKHLAIARMFGPYKLSLHSGSDKFAVYPVAARLAGELVHLKTAGTSYLEALRAIASEAPALFREIVRFAIERYPIDRASYHVSAELAKVPDVSAWTDRQLPELLDQFDARQVLHVTFGSVLLEPAFRERFFETLQRTEETYYGMLHTHFRKHLDPFK
jgi:tagaturonate epimerase